MRSTNFVESYTLSTSIELDLSLQHLQAELARIDVLIRRAVQRWQLAGQDPLDTFRGLYISDEQADALMARPICTNWGHSVSLESERLQAFADTQLQADLQVRALAESARCHGHTPRLKHLATVFNLSQFDKDVLLICLAPALDLRYERLYGYLQDDITRKRPSVNLVLDLLCDPGPERLLKLSHFADSAPLFDHHLLQLVTVSGKSPLLRQTLMVDTTIVTWLLGDYRPHPELSPHTMLLQPEGEHADELLAGKIWSGFDHTLTEHPILVFHGPDQTCQDAAARMLAAQEKRHLLKVDLAAQIRDGIHPFRALKLALRDARLVNAIPYLTGWDACLADGAPASDVFAELCAYPDLAIVAGSTSWQPRGIQRDRTLIWLDFPVPAFHQRLALWNHFVDQIEPEGDYDLVSLAGQFQLTTGQIRDAVASAGDVAVQRGGILQDEDLFAAARGHSNPHLAGLACKITPRYRWEDIVLPGDQLDLLREIVATVRCRPKVLDEWGVGQKLASSRGVTALFAGPSGTGKTMAAEIITADLGLDLYKIDLSTVVSKYIGETEKNLERIFSEAETSNAILFFDEADALFGKRSEVRDSHDRYANIETSYLLQRMEAYNGVTILATNLRANLDEAFTRRLQFAVDFPFPDQADRLRIWQTLFPPDLPYDAELDFSWMASRFKLAGGNIRNIIVNAAYLAADDGQRVTMGHLLHGTRRELQKMGRLVNEEDVTAG